MIMAELNLKPCPFCGGRVKFVERIESPSHNDTTVCCTGCNMEFSYSQDFAFSKSARVALNEPFEEHWNRRVDNG